MQPAPPRRARWVSQPSTRPAATEVRSAGETMPRNEGGHEQLSDKGAEEQADEAVDGGGKREIELRGKAVEDRLGYLTTRTSLIGGDILGRDYRAQQIGAAFDPLIGGLQAALAVERSGESFRIRRFDGAQLGEKASIIFTRRNPIEPLCRGLALRDFLVGACVPAAAERPGIRG